MRASPVAPPRFAAALIAAVLTGCGAPPIPVVEPKPAPPPGPARATPEQFQLVEPRAPEPQRLAPLLGPPLRLAVVVRVTTDDGDAAEDPSLEGIAAGAILAVRPAEPADPAAPRPRRLDVVNRHVLGEALGRDLRALATRKRELDAEILRNLAAAGVDLVAVGDVAASATDLAAVAGEARPRAFAVEASVSIARVDDASTLATGTGSSRRPAAVEARREALRAAASDAARRLFASSERRAQPETLVTLTVEGLRSEEQAAKVEKALRASRGVLWVKAPRFQLGPESPLASVARFEVGFRGAATTELKDAIRGWDLGFRLTGTILEGNRWAFRAEEAKP
ncbi:MAG: hypothetical protein HY721_24675 [Planctomycetes bacterium]|nr:hypothetical protein [Planctomycetota bacterium]